MNTTLISTFVLQLNYQKHTLPPASASPEEAQRLPERPGQHMWDHHLTCAHEVCLIFSKELFAEGYSPPGLILSELP